MFKHWHQKGTITDKQIRYEGPVFSVSSNQIETPDGLTVERDLVHCSPTVTILAISNTDRVALTSEYRVGINGNSVSLPAGLINPGESALTAAKREFTEKTGYHALSATLMTTITSSEGFMDQTAALVLIKFNERIRGKSHFDTDEFVTTQLVDYSQVLTWIKSGTINTAQALSAVGYFQNFIATKKA